MDHPDQGFLTLFVQRPHSPDMGGELTVFYELGEDRLHGDRRLIVKGRPNLQEGVDQGLRKHQIPEPEGGKQDL